MKLEFVVHFSVKLFFIFNLFDLVVESSTKHAAPKFTAEPSDTFVVDGNPARLTCRANGEPAPR